MAAHGTRGRAWSFHRSDRVDAWLHLRHVVHPLRGLDRPRHGHNTLFKEGAGYDAATDPGVATISAREYTCAGRAVPEDRGASARPSPLDLELHRLAAQQSIDLYELVIGRHRSSSFVITSNRAVEEWLGLFDDPILGNSALDRLANASYQVVIEGESYRQRLSPHRALLEAQTGGD